MQRMDVVPRLSSDGLAAQVRIFVRTPTPSISSTANLSPSPILITGKCCKNVSGLIEQYVCYKHDQYRAYDSHFPRALGLRLRKTRALVVLHGRPFIAGIVDIVDMSISFPVALGPQLFLPSFSIFRNPDPFLRTLTRMAPHVLPS